MYMQARYYDPVIGRFYSNDPVDALGHMQRGNSIAHGFNRYVYANNNPYKYTDPDGEFLVQAVGFFVGAASTYKAAEKAGLEGGSLLTATLLGGGLGALTGGKGGNLVVSGVKSVLNKGLNQSGVATASQVAGSTLSGGISGVVGEVTGSISGGELPTSEGLMEAGGLGAAQGFAGAALGSPIAGETGAAIGTAIVTTIGNAVGSEEQTPVQTNIKEDEQK